MAAKSLNKVMLIGNVTRDPELRYTPQGNAVATFGLATNRSWKTDAGELREEAEFHRLVAWNKLAELCSQLCTKGRKIYVEGRLQTRTFTGSDNAQHTITEIVIDDMILLDSKFAHPSAGSGQEGGVGYQPPQPAAAPTASAEEPTAEGPETGAGTPPVAVALDQKAKKSKSSKKKDQEEPASSPAAAEGGSEAKEEKVDLDEIPF